jgi:hypothetical protein
VYLLPAEHEPDTQEPDFDPDEEPEDFDASPGDTDVDADLEDADADLEDADATPEEAPPISSLDAGSPLDAATSADAGSATDAQAAPDATPALDAAPPMDSAAPPDAAGSTDAGVDAALEAGTDASAPDASLPACAGARARNLCWYFGPLNNSCLQVCSARGGYDSRMVGIVGSTPQGGTVEACNEVLAALGLDGTATPARRTDDKGYGCHEWGGDLWWLDSAPDFRPDVAGTSARIACACLQ